MPRDRPRVISKRVRAFLQNQAKKIPKGKILKKEQTRMQNVRSKVRIQKYLDSDLEINKQLNLVLC